MRQFLITLLLIFFITIHANETNEYKIILASFKTLDEAKKNLDTFGNQLTSEDIELQKTYNFDIVARPSGKVFIVAIEPIKDVQSAKLISNHIKRYFPDVLVGSYFGPTKGSIVWKKNEASINLPSRSQFDPNKSKSESTEQVNSSFAWKVIISLIILSFIIALLILFFKPKKSPTQNLYYSKKTKPHLFVSKGWKYDDALQRSGGNREYLKLIIKKFINEVPLIIQEIKDGINSEDFQKIQLRAHALKASAASIASKNLRENAQKLEYAARERNLQSAENALNECSSIYDNLLIELETLASHTQNDTAQNVAELPEISIITIEELRDILIKRIYIDMSHVKIDDRILEERRKPLLEELKTYIERLEYSNALELISHIEKIQSR